MKYKAFPTSQIYLITYIHFPKTIQTEFKRNDIPLREKIHGNIFFFLKISPTKCSNTEM